MGLSNGVGKIFIETKKEWTGDYVSPVHSFCDTYICISVTVQKVTIRCAA